MPRTLADGDFACQLRCASDSVIDYLQWCLLTPPQTLLFERLGIDDVKSRIIAACNGTEYFLASLIAIALIDRVGRRKLMLFGAFGQTLTMVLLAVLGSIDTSATQIVSAVLLFVFNSFFAVGWLGMTWLYVCHRT